MKKVISIVLAAGILTSMAGCGKKKEMPNEGAASNATNVTVHTAEIGSITNTVTYTGEIKAASEVAVSPKVSGKVVSVYVEEGQYVNAGDVLFKIDDTDLKLSAEQAQAAYNSAKVAYDNTKNSTTKQSTMQAKQAYENAKDNYERQQQLYENNSNVKVAKTAVETASQAYETAKQNYENSLVAARNSLSTAQTNYENTAKLLEAGGATQIEFDNAKRNYENALASLETLEKNQNLSLENSKAALQQAEENLKTVEITASASLDSAKLAYENAKEAYELTVNVTNGASIKSAQAGVETASASLKLAQNNLKEAQVKAPISGYVSSKNINVGQMASAGMTAVTIHNTNSVDGEINVTESVISSLRLGTPASISVKSAGIENMAGTVSVLNQVKDAASGMYKVQVNIPNPDNQLKTGMFADITLQTAAVDDVICIPSESILQSDTERFVYIAKGENAEKRVITEGTSNGEFTEITNGVEEGDQVIIKGKDYITEKNTSIRIVED